jgi:alginate O-acetyltransferase complex protein AlgI
VQFPTLIFAVFFSATLTAYWLARPSRLAQKLVLLTASLFFYGLLGWKILAVLLAAAGANYLLGNAISLGRGSRRRRLMVAGILLNVGLLGFFKYYNFLADQISSLLGVIGFGASIPLIEIIAPIGISFYTFQHISYLVDLSRDKGVRAQSLLDYLVYTAFFPKVLAGPICRGRELLPQLHGPCPEGIPKLSIAVSLVLSGLMKKAVLGTFLDTHMVGKVFDSPENFTAGALWLGMLGYSMLLYWDFSGYTDLARGVALMLGFELPENFNHPYISTDISDFWRRWHMSLSFWLRDYLFMPLGGMSIKGRWSALVLSMTIAGLWHGASWTFVIWGFYHGVMLLCHHGLRHFKRKWNGGWPGRVGTFLLVSLGWVLFRASDFELASNYYRRMVDFTAPGQGVELIAVSVIAIGLLLQVLGPGLRGRYISWSERLPWALRPVMWFGTGMLILALKPSGIAPYIYFGF